MTEVAGSGAFGERWSGGYYVDAVKGNSWLRVGTADTVYGMCVCEKETVEDELQLGQQQFGCRKRIDRETPE